MSNTPEQMRRSWLIQRLTKPHRSDQMGGFLASMAFGGGLRNGGLSDEAMGLLRQVFAFDYMGAAEFEFGAVPKALQRIAADKTLVASSFDMDVADVKPSWRDKEKRTGTATIYVLCPAAWTDEVQYRILGWASGPEELKEGTRLADTLRPVTEWDGEKVGWLELDNGFMFFTDREMWAQTASLFGVKAEVPA